MDIAKKLRQVVTANFIEIVKSDEDARPKQNVSSLDTVASLPPVPTRVPSDSSAEALAAAERKARQELDALNSILEAKDIEEPVSAESIAQDAEPVAIKDAASDVVEPIEFVGGIERTDDDTIDGAVAIPVEPPVVETEATPGPEPAPVFDPMAFVNSDGTLDFARMLKAANLPAVSFTAEQALKLISALPEDLPMRGKRATVKAMLEAVSPETAEDARDVLADAMLKRLHVGQLRDSLAELVETELRNRQEEIAQLRATLERLGGEVIEFQRRQKLFAESCTNYINQFHQVVLFFQTEESAAPAITAEAEDDEIPPFMREDTVFRLLGMNGSENGSEESEDPARSGGTTVERGRGRR